MNDYRVALKLIHEHKEFKNPDEEDPAFLSVYGPIHLNLSILPRIGESIALSIRRYDVKVPVKYVMLIVAIEHHLVDGAQLLGLLATVRPWEDDGGEIPDPMFNKWLPPEEQSSDS